MIDEDWLDQQLRFELPRGYRLDGCQVGGSWVALKVIYPDGKPWAIRIPKELFLFPSYIHEVPNWIAPSPQYDLGRLNRKLGGLLGDPQLHILISSYNNLFSSFVNSFQEAGVSDLDEIVGETEEATQAIRFFLQTQAVSYRLEDLSSQTEDPRTREWAEGALEALARMGSGDPQLRPESLLDNPLFVWGGAVMSGFFTRAELPYAVSDVVNHMDSVSEQHAQAFLRQAVLLIEALRDIVGDGLGLRQLCDATAFFPWQFSTEEEMNSPDEFCTFLSALDSGLASENTHGAAVDLRSPLARPC
jgi:hypothetical protein